MEYSITHLELKDTPIVKEAEYMSIENTMQSLSFDSRFVERHCNERFGLLGDNLGLAFCRSTFGFCNDVCKANELQF